MTKKTGWAFKFNDCDLNQLRPLVVIQEHCSSKDPPSSHFVAPSKSSTVSSAEASPTASETTTSLPAKASPSSTIWTQKSHVIASCYSLWFSVCAFAVNPAMKSGHHSPPHPNPASPGLGAPHLLHSCLRAKLMFPQELHGWHFRH